VRGTSLAHEVMPSPNFDERKNGIVPNILLLHYTGMASADMALKRLCDSGSKVSSHYLVHEDGRIVHMVSEDARAWHAGVSSWHGKTDINTHSIGIEIQNIGHNGDCPPFGDAQMLSVRLLCADILVRNAIEPQDVIAHSDVAPGRKTDPGEKFDWRSLWRQGIGHWVEPSPMTNGATLQRGDTGSVVMWLQSALISYGYGLAANGDFDEATHIVVEAFQRHFRPARVDGVWDRSTEMTLQRLQSTLPLKAAGTV
jgi:N-acetylmuramoyl-L-alanine amidase